MPELTDTQLDQLITDIGLRPRKGPGARAACGTPAGYERHRKDDEEACDACRAANTQYKAEQYRQPVKDPSRLKPISHGTPRGAKQHRYRQEPLCQPCRDAENAYQRERTGGKPRKTAAPKPQQFLTEKEWQARGAARRNGGAQ